MADNTEKKVLIDVIIKATDSIKEIVKLQDEATRLKDIQKQLDLTTQEGREQYEALGTEIRNVNSEIRKRRNEVDKNIKQAQAEKGSLDSLSIALSKAKAEYRALSQADRDSAKGQAMRDSILATNNALKAAEEAYGDFYRSVGDYNKINKALKSEIDGLNKNLKELADQFLALDETAKQSEAGQALIAQMNQISSSIDQAKQSFSDYANAQQQYNQNLTSLISGNNQLVGSLIQTVSSGQGATAAFKALGTQVAAFGKALLSLLANPIVLIIAAIVAVVMLLVKAFQRNEENANKLNVVIAKLSGVFSWLLDKLEPIASFLVDVLIFAFEKLAEQIEWTINKIADAMEFLGMESAAKWVRDTTTEIKAMTKAAEDLAKAEAELKKQQREANKIQKEYQKQAEKLRQVRDDETKTIQERIKANDELGKVLKDQLQAEMRIAQKALEVANLRLKVEGRTSDNLDAQAEALEKIADIQERITGQESEQLTNRVSLQKEAADKAYEYQQKTLENQRAFNEASIMAESGYQSENFQIRQSYDKKLFELSQNSAKKQLDLQLRYGKITGDEYKAQIKILEAQQQEFTNGQIKATNNYYLEQRQQLLDMIEKDTTEQIKDVNDRYNKAIKDLNNIQEPVKLIGQSDEEFQQEYEKYKNLMFENAAISVQLEKQRQKDINEINESGLQKRLSDIEKAVSKEYQEDLAKFTDNEREKNSVLQEQLKKQIEEKEKVGLQTYDDEAQLRSLQSQANQLQLNTELLQANENARAKYDIRKTYLEKEAEIYKDNADKLIDINNQLKENDKELMEARIESLQKWGSQTTELMSSVSSLFSAIEDSNLQHYEEVNDQKKALLDDRLSRGLISQDEYDKQVAAADAELEKQKVAAARRQAIRDKAAKVFEIGINTASGIMKAVAESPLTFGLPWSAFVGATGVLQLATVLAEPLPKASKGMLLNGPSHALGGIPIEAEGGEAIINKRSTALFKPLLSAINVAGGGVPFVSAMSDGGYSARMAVGSGNAGITKNEMQEIIGGVKIYTTVEDYRRADADYTIIEDRGQF